MKITSSHWFNGMFGTIGIVVGEDERTQQRKAYMGPAPGYNEDLDAQHIAKIGAPVMLSQIKDILRAFQGMLDISVDKEKQKTRNLIIDQFLTSQYGFGTRRRGSYKTLRAIYEAHGLMEILRDLYNYLERDK